MKKIHIFLISILSILLSGCSFFQNENNTKNAIDIGPASFKNTFSTITFSFKENENAIFYNAYLKGESNLTLSKVKPSVEYDIHDLPQGKYNVFLKAFSNSLSSDSELTLLGEMNKVKAEKEIEKLEISASLQGTHELSISVKNNDGKDSSAITSNIYKDNKIVHSEKNIVKNKTYTYNVSEPGEYKISAFFDETKNYLQSEEKFYESPFVFEQRKIEIYNFKSTYNKGKIVLNWGENVPEDISVSRKLTISNSGQSKQYTNFFKNSKIENGLTLNASEFQEGSISFSIQIAPGNGEELFEESDESLATTTISKYKLDTPVFAPTFDASNGTVKINCNYKSGEKYKLKIYPFEENGDYSPVDYFEYEQEVNSFPIIFERTHELWKHGEYVFELKQISTNPLEIDSDAATSSVTVDKVSLSPDFSFTKTVNPTSEGGGWKYIFSSRKPNWVSKNSWTNNCFQYSLSFCGHGDEIRNYSFGSEEEDFTFIFPEMLASSVYSLSLSIDTTIYEGVDFYYGYKTESTVIEEWDLYDNGNGFPLISDADFIRLPLPYGFLPPDDSYKVYVNKKYAFLDLRGEAIYYDSYLDQETREEITFYNDDDIHTGMIEGYFQIPRDYDILRVEISAFIGDDCDFIEIYPPNDN